jgi:protein-L-isoaspartate(D-aspartate) O-methyltransferase
MKFDFDKQRQALVEIVKAKGITDQRVLDALARVPRHLFMPKQHWHEAYEDYPVPIGEGQTISQPYIVAFMTEILEIDSSHTVLEIGTGSGYQAAVLSPLVKQVYSIEIIKALADRADRTLQKLGYKNINVRWGDGYAGWPEKAPFDRIIGTAAPPEIPPALIDQLKPGGIMVLPVGNKWQELVVVKKSNSGTVSKETVLPVRFVPMVHPE